MLRLALALIALSPLARCDDYTYHTGGDQHYGSDPVDYTAHNYGDGATPAHGDEAYDGPLDPPTYDDHAGDTDDGNHHYHYAHHDYGAGDASNYATHGSLLLDDPDALHEFLAMDLLETAAVCVLPPGTPLDAPDDAPHPEFEAYRALAQDYSHLFRFGHSTSAAVAAELQLTGLQPGESAVVVQPAALLAANHPRAGGWLRFPGQRVARGPLETFLFMEAAPLVGQYDWRSLERAAAVQLPAVIVFARLTDELKHTYHDQDAEQQDEDMSGSSSGSSSSGSGEASAAARAPPGGFDGVWTFDALTAALRPVGLAHRHQLNLLVADPQRHSHELQSYNLHLPEADPFEVGLGLVLDGTHYARAVHLPGQGVGQDPGAALAHAVGDFIEMFFDGLLKAEKTQ